MAGGLTRFLPECVLPRVYMSVFFDQGFLGSGAGWGGVWLVVSQPRFREEEKLRLLRGGAVELFSQPCL